MATSLPTFTPSTGAGTGATASTVGQDSQGQITVTTGTTPVLGAVIGTLSFGEAYVDAPNGVILTPANNNAALACVNVWAPKTSLAAAGFDLKNVGVALTGGLTYIWYFSVF
jgi:hypothetical protein